VDHGGVSRLTPTVALLTGGQDKPYALGLAAALASKGVGMDFIGSDDVDGPELHGRREIRYLNLRGCQRRDARVPTKILRVLKYYLRLLAYAVTAQPAVFHILWNEKLEIFDRVALPIYYRFLRRRIVFTAHNVNAGTRDRNDSWLNRLSLKIQYNLSNHVFVHTNGMKEELISDFRIPAGKMSVIPFGINNTVPSTSLSSAQARRQLSISEGDKTLLFFGNIAPYKGLEYLISAFTELSSKDRSYRLIIVGKPKGSEGYWKQIHQEIARGGIRDRVIERIEYIPDEETELFFKAADVLILPYNHVFQSGVLFLGYGFGLPAIASDVGTLKDEIMEGQTGFVFKPQDSSDLARKVDEYFKSELFRNLETRRAEIKAYANERYSWDKVAAVTTSVYSRLLNSNI